MLGPRPPSSPPSPTTRAASASPQRPARCHSPTETTTTSAPRWHLAPPPRPAKRWDSLLGPSPFDLDDADDAFPAPRLSGSSTADLTRAASPPSPPPRVLPTWTAPSSSTTATGARSGTPPPPAASEAGSAATPQTPVKRVCTRDRFFPSRTRESSAVRYRAMLFGQAHDRAAADDGADGEEPTASDVPPSTRALFSHVLHNQLLASHPHGAVGESPHAAHRVMRLSPPPPPPPPPRLSLNAAPRPLDGLLLTRPPAARRGMSPPPPPPRFAASPHQQQHQRERRSRGSGGVKLEMPDSDDAAAAVAVARDVDDARPRAFARGTAATGGGDAARCRSRSPKPSSSSCTAPEAAPGARTRSPPAAVPSARPRTPPPRTTASPEAYSDEEDEEDEPQPQRPPSSLSASTKWNTVLFSNPFYDTAPVDRASQAALTAAAAAGGKKRAIAAVPYKVLDAPALADDYYLNLLDWSSRDVVAVGLGSSVYLWSAASGAVTQLCDVTAGDADTVTSVAWNERGNYLAVGTLRGRVQLWDVAHARLVRHFNEAGSGAGRNARVGVVKWHRDLVTAGSRDARILDWDHRAPRTPAMALAGHAQEVCGLDWNPEGRSLASGGNDNRLLVWDPRHSLAPVVQIYEHSAAVRAINWSPHRSGILASGGGTADQTICIWDVRGSNPLTSPTTSTSSPTIQPLTKTATGSQVCTLRWSPTSPSELVSTHGYSENAIIVWDHITTNGNNTLRPLATLTGHRSRVLYQAMSPDGTAIVTGAGDETLRFWNVFPPAAPAAVATASAGATPTAARVPSSPARARTGAATWLHYR
ncbi:substrate-specific activator of APC-dependent proteolysis [Blastocladiella emersonii ATCC 22665]|nr:substrate-specific activator of APC-dependent proteolysis [Blastocladiella emersonii ATCC 22665]